MTQPAHDWRSHYALLVLLFVYTMSFIDRQIMGLLVRPIKQKFGMSDTAMGLLTGLAFAVFCSALVIAFGRYADRSNRAGLRLEHQALRGLAAGACASSATGSA